MTTPPPRVEKRTDDFRRKHVPSRISSSLSRLLGLLEGVVSLVFLTLLAYSEKSSSRGSPSATSSEDDNKTSHELWSLTTDSLEFEHNFLLLPGDVQLHYLTPSAQHGRSGRLVVFLHGFPDSCHLWTHLFRSSLAQHANLVALDLPGYGGSDGLPAYGPDEVLTTVSYAIRELRHRYSIDEATIGETSHECIVVGHDWGGIIASRIAAATDGIIDHLVLVNSVFTPHFQSRMNMHGSIALAPFRARPSGVAFVQFIRAAKASTLCMLSQLLKSHYIFMFNLPFFSAAKFPSAMRFLLAFCHRTASREASRRSGWHNAASQGPKNAQSQPKTRSDWGYGHSVSVRASHQPDKIWDERIRLYQEGLLGKPWKTAANTNDTAELHERLDERKIRCRTTIIFGLEDQALDPRLVVDGIEDHVQSRADLKGQVILLEGVGHWSPLHPIYGAVLEEIITRPTNAATPLCSTSGAEETGSKTWVDSDKVRVRTMK